MPGRKVILTTNEIYHVFNRGVASQPTFITKNDYQRALNTFLYYQNRNLPVRYSHFIVQPQEERNNFLKGLNSEKNFWAKIISFCFMPNHFHFLLKQTVDNGISKFLSNFTNSYARYFNVKNNRQGPLFQGRFKAVRIETDEQLLHISRYIHLNPYSSYVVRNFKDLINYPFSSLAEFLGKRGVNFCNKGLILDFFKKKEAYKKFVLDQADYQRNLQSIKHLTLEE